MNEWKIIVAWIKEQEVVPEDAEVELVSPLQIGDNPDKRLWIDVLSEEWGIEHSDGSHPSDPEGYYDPTVKQYQLIEVDKYFKMKLRIADLEKELANEKI